MIGPAANGPSMFSAPVALLMGEIRSCTEPTTAKDFNVFAWPASKREKVPQHASLELVLEVGNGCNPGPSTVKEIEEQLDTAIYHVASLLQREPTHLLADTISPNGRPHLFRNADKAGSRGAVSDEVP